MANKPTYKELEQKVKALEEEKMIARERVEELNKSESCISGYAWL
jgi:hypothetical protein